MTLLKSNTELMEEFVQEKSQIEKELNELKDEKFDLFEQNVNLKSKIEYCLLLLESIS